MPESFVPSEGSLPNLGANFDIFENYAKINPKLRAQIEGLSLHEQTQRMRDLTTVLGRVPMDRVQDLADHITDIKDLDELVLAPPPLPRDDEKATRKVEAAKGEVRRVPRAPITAPKAEVVGSFDQLAPPARAIVGSPRRQLVRPSEALTVPRAAATGLKREVRKAVNADEEPTSVIFTDAEIEDVKNPTVEQLRKAIRARKEAPPTSA